MVGNESNSNLLIHKSILKEYKTYGSNKINKVDDLNNQEVDKIIALKIDDLNFDKNISAMKIDIQGYDLEALKGAEKTILKHKMPIIFEYEEKFGNEFNYSFKDFEDFISKINYKIKTKIDEINYLIIPQ